MKQHATRQILQTINSFFDCYALPQAIEYLDDWLYAATTENEQWQHGCPANLLWFHDHLRTLIKSIQHVQKLPQYALQKKYRATPTDARHYTGKYRFHTAWEYFPRSLSQDEFIHPHKAVKKCMAKHSCRVWKRLLETLLHAALSNDSVYYDAETIHIMETTLLLKKLIEAAHVIHLRSTKAKTKKTKTGRKSKK